MWYIVSLILVTSCSIELRAMDCDNLSQEEINQRMACITVVRESLEQDVVAYIEVSDKWDAADELPMLSNIFFPLVRYPMINYYEELGVAIDASCQEIELACNRADNHEARIILTDPQLRVVYDTYGMPGVGIMRQFIIPYHAHCMQSVAKPAWWRDEYKRDPYVLFNAITKDEPLFLRALIKAKYKLDINHYPVSQLQSIQIERNMHQLEQLDDSDDGDDDDFSSAGDFSDQEEYSTDNSYSSDDDDYSEDEIIESSCLTKYTLLGGSVIAGVCLIGYHWWTSSKNSADCIPSDCNQELHQKADVVDDDWA